MPPALALGWWEAAVWSECVSKVTLVRGVDLESIVGAPQLLLKLPPQEADTTSSSLLRRQLRFQRSSKRASQEHPNGKKARSQDKKHKVKRA